MSVIENVINGRERFSEMRDIAGKKSYWQIVEYESPVWQ